MRHFDDAEAEPTKKELQLMKKRKTMDSKVLNPFSLHTWVNRAFKRLLTRDPGCWNSADTPFLRKFKYINQIDVKRRKRDLDKVRTYGVTDKVELSLVDDHLNITCL